MILALEAMTRWIESIGLDLATQRIEAVLFGHCCWLNTISVHLKREVIALCTVVEYFGLRFDGKLSFKTQVKESTARAEQIVGASS